MVILFSGAGKRKNGLAVRLITVIVESVVIKLIGEIIIAFVAGMRQNSAECVIFEHGTADFVFRRQQSKHLLPMPL